MAKFYGVKEGRVPGVYLTWPEAERQVKGYSGAVYRSFASRQEAEAYVYGKAHQASKELDSQVRIYVDGSFDQKTQQYGSGVVVTQQGQIIHQLKMTGRQPDFIESYQIAGEVKAALLALQWAVDNQCPEITLVYDYKGIEAWARQTWQAKKPISQYYLHHYQAYAEKVQVHFEKVQAHSGDPFNDRADALAKEAARAT